MVTSNKPDNELERIEALGSLNILDTKTEQRIDRVIRLASQYFNVPHVLFSLLDAERQWIESSGQLDIREIHRELSICNHTKSDKELLIVEDTLLDDRFTHLPLVSGEMQIRFYAGIAVLVGNQINVGSLCLLDTRPRPFSQDDAQALTDFAAVIEGLLEADDVAEPLEHMVESARQFQQTRIQLKDTERLNRIRNHILELIVTSKPLTPILTAIVNSVEQEYEGMLCSILLIDDSGQYLKHGAAPSLPDFYNNAIDGEAIGMARGSCGTAAFTGERVIVEDIMTHPYWAQWKGLAAQAGLGSSWSEPIKNAEGKVLGTFAIYHSSKCVPSENDVRLIEQFANLASISIERQRNNETIWRQANFDDLTGLPNRNMMGEHLQLAMNTARRNASKIALIFLDLDNFKDINDTLGHSMGDDMLVECARRIKQSLRANDHVARLGGDEFVIIVTDLTDLHGLESLIRVLLARLGEPYRLKEAVCHSSASIGITIFPDDAEDINSLLKNADQAMYQAKKLGRNNYQYYTQSMREDALYRMQLINDLRDAIENREFSVVYQPIIDLHSGRICKAESLLRWNHPTGGVIGPAEFIPLAEETGLIVDLSDWVFNEVTTQLKEWRQSYCSDLQISINTSPVQYNDINRCITTWLTWMLDRQIPPDGIALEITENLLMDANKTISDKLYQFYQAGVEIALDDFGTGYSSISYLKKFPTNYLKIDKSFVLSMNENSQDRVLCEAIIVMAKKLGIKVIAEGIETQEQYQLLVKMGCEFGQGYFFSVPLESKQFSELLAVQISPIS